MVGFLGCLTAVLGVLSFASFGAGVQASHNPFALNSVAHLELMGVGFATCACLCLVGACTVAQLRRLTAATQALDPMSVPATTTL